MGTLRRGLHLATIAIATGMALVAGIQMPTAYDDRHWHNPKFRNRQSTRQPNKGEARAENRKKNKAARKARSRNRS